MLKTSGTIDMTIVLITLHGFEDKELFSLVDDVGMKEHS